MRYLPLLLLLMASSCAIQQPISREAPENNQTYKVEYLFEHEGCKVYRFLDRGYYVYFTNCNGQAIAKTDSSAVTNMTHVLKN